MNSDMPAPFEHEMQHPLDHEHIPEHIRFLQTLSSAPRTPSSPVHFVTMMIKNFRQKLRTPAGTILEIILPVIFVLGLMAIWAATASGNVSDTQYVNQSMTTVPTPNTPSQVIATYICSNGTVIPTIRACTTTELSSNNINCPAVPLSGRPIPVKGLCYIGNGANLLNSWLDFRRPRFIPSMDELIVMQWLTRIAISQKTRDSSYGQTLEGLSNNGMLHFTPNTPEVNNFVTYLSGVSTLFPYVQGQVFNNADTARSYVSSNANTDTAWAIVEIGAMTTSTIDVTIHMNRSGLPWTNKVIEVGNGIGSFSTGKYIAAGFITLQDLVNRYYETQILGVTTPLQLVHIPMPYRGYDTSAFLTVVGTLASLFLVFGYIYPVSQLVKRIVEEKEQKVREAMMIMGLATAPFYSSWVITYFVMQVITSLICAGILKGTMFPKSDFAIIWALYFMFGLSNITFSSILSSFFSKSRIAALVAPVIFFICAVPSFALPDTTPASTLIIISLLSPTAFANGMNVLVDQEINGGMTNATIGESFNGYPMTIVLFMLTLDTVLYFLLTLYFDAILPSEWGTHKHPCFCYCCFCSKSDHRGEHGFEGVADGRDPTGAYEAETPGIKPAVELRGLRKEFDTDAGKMVAVDNLTFNMYEGQVFCLLGHNGAGKSTAMNLMTGMLDLDAGDCYFHGNSVTHDLDLVRREIGYCPQHNILWPELTCREHLHFFARLKGLDGDMREKAVEAVLKAVDLEDKADKFSTELSGGQKRKLSVAIAFVGGSRVVFLDEPSAGMDVDARRHTWDLIKYMTPGRTIVLTTHYMEEADLLGHTIAIMSKGRLKCSGSGVFLKSRLGVGYNFTVTCAHGTNNTNHIIDAVQRYVPDASILSNAAGEVSLRLPLHAVPAFPPLLQYFENNGPAMGVRGHGISVTTLEEIFLKLGHDEEGEKEDHVPTPIVANPVDAQFQNYNSGHQIPTYTPVAVDETKGLIWTPEVANSHPTSMGQMTALFLKRFNYARRDTRTIVMQIVLPVVCILFAMLLTLIKFPDAPRLTFEPSIYPDSVGSAFAGCPANWNLYTVNSTTTVDSLGSNSLQLSQFLLDTYKKHTRHRVGSHVCADNSITSVSTSSTVSAPSAVFFTNTSIYRHSGPHAVWELHTATMRYNTQRNIVNHMSTYPFPLSARESAVIAAITTLFVALFVMIPLTFVPSTFVSFVVKERETRALQLQQASGLKFIVYWVSNYIFDLVSFLFTALLIITVFAIFGRDEYIGSGELFIATLILFIIYGFASVSSSYIMSFGFDSHSTAQNIVMLVNFICGFMLVLLAYILSIIDSTKDAGSAIKYVFRLVPSYCLGEGILNLANRQLQAGYASAPDAFDMSVLGWPLLYMAIEAPIFFAITLYIDSPLRRSQQHSLTGDATAPASIEHEDEDVLVERQEIESGQRDATDVVVVKNLRKVYHGRKDVVAVQNLSFGVHKGEVFGFLGTNGAGKTTTISILCGEHMPSYGRGWIGGFDVVSQASQARAMIGYCPQFDATHDLLTAEEHLALYAGLHGLQSPLKEQVIERLIHVCGLQEHRAKESRSLSGGNRRKLSVAISLVGAPQVVFLDEPSAGMDPMARRGLFDVIEQIARHASVILTTHHLEEVEALSNRVGIMVNGELRCIGPLQHLKTKFGSGFEMTMRVSREDRVPQAISFITGNLAQARIQEQRGGKLTVALPQSTRLSSVFQLLETNKSVLGITDYSILQTSLESVFLRISADAKAEE